MKIQDGHQNPRWPTRNSVFCHLNPMIFGKQQCSVSRFVIVSLLTCTVSSYLAVEVIVARCDTVTVQIFTLVYDFIISGLMTQWRVLHYETLDLQKEYLCRRDADVVIKRSFYRRGTDRNFFLVSERYRQNFFFCIGRYGS